jgi:hypothetical protein
LGLFLDSVIRAKQLALPGDWPWVEAERGIIDHFLRGQTEGFEQIGYFIYQDVKVYERGRREEADARDALTSEDKNFGKKA